MSRLGLYLNDLNKCHIDVKYNKDDKSLATNVVRFSDNISFI